MIKMLKNTINILCVYIFHIVLIKAQNVGINNDGSVPSQSLHIHENASTGKGLKITNSTTGNAVGDGFDIKQNGSDIQLLQNENAAARIFTNGTERVTITSSGSVGIGTSSPNSNAALDIAVSGKGVLFPRLTSTQRDAIVSPMAGLMIMNTTTNCFEIFSGLVWLSSCAGFQNTGGTTCTVNGGTASTSSSSVACGSTVTLTLTGEVGNVYQWQKSSNNSIFTDIVACTTGLCNTVINSCTSASGTQYVRCRMSDGTCTSYSNAVSITNTCASDSWCQKENIPAYADRTESVSFSVGTKGYISTGYDNSIGLLLNDLWEYDPSTDTWAQKSNFPGVARCSAAAFASSTKGYVGTGLSTYGDLSTALSDFYEYNPTTNIWTAIASHPNAVSSSAAAFDGTYGYLVGGDNSAGNKVPSTYRYTVGSPGSWNIRANLTGFGRRGAVAFVLGSTMYVGTGEDASTNHLTSFYKYNNGSNTWSSVASITGVRDNAFAFTDGTYAYVGGGYDVSDYYVQDTYKYNSSTNTWSLTLSTTPIYITTAFGNNGKGYTLSDVFYQYTP